MRYGHKFIADVVLWTLATPLAFILRYDGAIPANVWPTLYLVTATAFILKIIASYSFKLYLVSWRNLSLYDLRNIVKAVTILSLVMMALFFLAYPSPYLKGLPRSVPLIDGLIALVSLSSMRIVRRFVYEQAKHKLISDELPLKRVLLVGAGEAGSLLANELRRHQELAFDMVGFVDDDKGKIGQIIAGLPVLGTLEDLPRLIGRHGVDEVLIAIASAGGGLVRKVIQLTAKAERKVSYRIIPSVYELLNNKVTVERLREVKAEDLLRREPVPLDRALVASYLQGSVVLVTGAGGSIGSELVRQIASFFPRQLILLGRGENSLFHISKELDNQWPDVDYVSVVGDIRSSERLNYIFQNYKPSIVFHAAAHKHVGLMEYNPEEAVLNNILGTKNLLDIAHAHGVRRFVNISTDKAVKPTTIMGSSKYIAERLVIAQAETIAANIESYVSVRFGNVMDSRGSVIPLFKQQIRAGGPITITHPDATRYFMTIPEAAQLVLQAAGLAENGAIYILDMGEPVKILDLARDLISLSGLEPDKDISIIYTGLVPGEKLNEALWQDDESKSATRHEKIFVARSKSLEPSQLDAILRDLAHAAHQADRKRIRHILERNIPGAELHHRINPETYSEL
ncbi:MAG: nucleoside-diphosphate sugar epimerase/dehydratase [Deinococcales bacterium]